MPLSVSVQDRAERRDPFACGDLAANEAFASLMAGAGEVRGAAAGAIGSVLAHPAVTGADALARAREIAASAWQPNASVRDESTQTLDHYLSREDGVDAQGVPRPAIEVLGTYGDIVITAPRSLTAERKSEFLSDTLRALDEGARHPRGRAMLAGAQEGGYPLVIELNSDGRNRFEPGERAHDRIGANFDRLEWDPGLAGVDRQSEAVVPPWLTLFHEIGHRLMTQDLRVASADSMSAGERALFPAGNIYAIADPAARGEADLIDAQGAPIAGGNGVRDDEDRVLIDYEWPLAREAGLVPRPTYFAIDRSERVRVADPVDMTTP